MVNCTKCQQVVKRAIDGSKTPIRRCTNGSAVTFKKEVTESDCSYCVLKQSYDCHCYLEPPENPIYTQPTFGSNLEILYVNGEPPCPYGYLQTENPLIFKSTWIDCPYMEPANELNKDGSVKIKARCSITQKLIDPETCQSCQGDISSIAPKEYPSLITELKTYTHAVKEWVAAKRPTRTDEEVAQLHEQYCSKCDWYDVEQSRCKGCGCKTKAEGAALLNKLKMGTQHCPKQLW